MKNNKSTAIIINGLLAIIIGVVFIISQGKAIEGILSIVGVIIAISGVIILAKYFFIDKKPEQKNIFSLLEGFLNLSLGLIIFIKPEIMIHFVMFLIGLWALFIGIVQISYLLKIRKIIKLPFLTLSGSIISMIIGIIFMFYPEIIISTFSVIIGIIILFAGITMLYLGYNINKANEKFDNYTIVE